ncbi:MAG: hypothetical protein JWL68_4157 [Actinomycetia bacterium]|nr:hypothetical protein [Actinomycetes bacterium]
MTAAAALITTRFAGPGVNTRLRHSREFGAPHARGDIQGWRGPAGLARLPDARPFGPSRRGNQAAAVPE